jgi:2-polyprenyl-6-methoxyphenol hydroxylase-like FAD-dependent oxidoreductase
MKGGKVLKQRAIIMGAGIVGLTTAKMLSSYVDEVVVFEQDSSINSPNSCDFGRRGAPQSYHPHILLLKGRQVLEQYFPGITHRCVSEGAWYFDYAFDTHIDYRGVTLPRFHSGIYSLACSRGLLERRLYQEVQSVDNIMVCDRATVREIGFHRAINKVVDVQVHIEGKGVSVFEADIFIDAMGRSSKSPQWLASKYGVDIKTTTVMPFAGYATCLYNVSVDQPTDWVVSGVSAVAPDAPKGSAMMHIEHHQLLVTLYSMEQQRLPSNIDTFLEYAQSIPGQFAYKTIQDLSPVSPVYRFKNLGNRYTHFEHVDMPCNYFVLGDSVSINTPVYAQGMSKGILGVQCLENTVFKSKQWRGRSYSWGRRRLLSNPFYKKQTKLLRSVWNMAVREDTPWLTTVMSKNSKQMYLTCFFRNLSQWYVQKWVEAMPQNPKLMHAFLQIMHLVRSPNSVCHIWVAWRLYWMRVEALYGRWGIKFKNRLIWGGNVNK